jgi:CIC family chloride channel protein
MAILMIFEMTLDYQVILPLMLACVIAQQISQGIHPRSIYSPALRRKGAGLVEARLAKLKVEDLLKPDPPSVGPSTPFSEVAQAFIRNRISWLYVTLPDGKWLGAISLHDVKAYLQQENLALLVIAGDVMREDIPALKTGDSLEKALECFSKFHGEHLPVISGDAVPLVLGTVAKNDLLLALAERAGPKIT